MSNSIRTIMAKAYKSVLSNPREAKFAYRMQTLFQKSEKRRRKMLEQEGLEVPPFLISSISTTCNLHCKGCYARSNGIAEDEKANQKATLTPEQWQTIIFLSFPGDEKALGGCLASGRGFFHIGPDGSAEPCPFSPFSDSNVATMGVRKALQSPLFRKIRAAKALGWEHTGGCTPFEHREEIEKMVI